MKKLLSYEFMEMLPRLLQAMKHVNDAGYVGVLSKNGADKLCHITETLQNILKNSKGISISQKPYVIFDAIGILVSFDEIIMNKEQISSFVSLLEKYQLDPEQIPLDMVSFHGGGLNFMVHDCYNITVGGCENE